VQGKDRRTIIATVLRRYDNQGVIRCELGVAEREVLMEHGSISDSFKFLCKQCHVRYDRGLSPPKTGHNNPNIPAVTNGERLQIDFFPADESMFKSLLIQRKRAYVRLYTSDGKAGPVTEWNAERFTETSNLRGNLFSGYLRNWKNRGIVKAELAIDRSNLKTLC
jgi:hypothetical protein